jgi:protein required for attachment to host cells
MTKALRTEFVIVDGARARWVTRSELADDFVTRRELKAPAAPAGHPQGVVFEGASGRRFTVERRNAGVQADRTRFAREVADAINAETGAGRLGRLALVARPRTLNAISKCLSGEAKARLAITLAKDLTKTPDHELGRWLRPLEQG